LNGIGPLGLPIQLLLVQILLITLLVHILAWPLSYMRQPRVIAEVIAGILLGPTAMGRIPGFTDAMFNKSSMLVLGTFANFGLILFLFMMGLELDLSLLRRNAGPTISIAVIGMVVPFGLGCAISYYLYTQFSQDNTVSFLAFLLFIGVAIAITAFPVLARILTELHLLNHRVGLATLSAAAVNDVAAWLLLALCIAVASAGNPLNILYIFLMLFGWLVLNVTLVRWVMEHAWKYMVTHNNVVSQRGVIICIMLCLANSWYTSFIGVHAIFGAFVTGIVLPRREKFAVQLTEKMEDLVAVVFLPLYFAYSGIRTDITQINTILAWVAVLVVVVTASVGKIGASMIAARLAGTESWRECLTLGIFMNCKGLVELIILNMGLDAGVLNIQVFAIMVLLALITTFMTTPMALWIFPPSKRGDMNSDETDLGPLAARQINPLLCATSHRHLPMQLALTQLIVNAQPTMHDLHQFRLFEITERQSSVIKAMLANEEKGIKDPIAREVIKFCKLNNLSVQNHFGPVVVQQFAQEVINVVETAHLNFILLPWPESESLHHFDSWRGCDEAIDDLFERSPVDVGLLIETSAILATSQMKILVFYRDGCPDDKAALRVITKFMHTDGVTVSLIHLTPRRTGVQGVSIDLSVISTDAPPAPKDDSSDSPPKHKEDIAFTQVDMDTAEKRDKKKNGIAVLQDLLFDPASTDDQIMDAYQALCKVTFTCHFAEMGLDEIKSKDFITKRNYLHHGLIVVGRRGDLHDLPDDDPLASLLGNLCAATLRADQVVSSILVIGSHDTTKFFDGTPNASHHSDKHDAAQIIHKVQNSSASGKHDKTTSSDGTSASPDTKIVHETVS